MVLTVDFTLLGSRVQGLNGGPDFRFNEALSFVVECEDQARWTASGTRYAGWRRAGSVRLAEGPVRTVVADRPAPANVLMAIPIRSGRAARWRRC